MSKDFFLQQGNVSRETMEKLSCYETLLQKWQAKINLIAASTVDDIWGRHFQDSYQLFSYLPDQQGSLLDLGSGAGFPGAVLAILGCANVTLVEKDQRKCSFLRTVSRETSTPFTVFEGAIETYPGSAELITSRALAPLDTLLSYAYPLLQPKGRCLFLKGKEAETEINAALQNWDMTITKNPSITSSEGVTLEISAITPR
jgi:16S rRNA (guanine527-N7)-methyltransferase